MSTTLSRVETFLIAILILISTGCGGGGGGGSSGGGSRVLVAAPAFTTGAPTSATVGSGYSYSVGVTGKPAPSLVASGLPAWLGLNGFVLSGTPAAGDVGTTSQITLTATNGVGAPATQTFQITVAPAGSASAPAFTSTAPSSAAAGVAYTYTISASGSPAPTISATTLPSWLTLAGNVLSGTPSALNAGANPVVLRATNASGTATQSFTIVVTSQTGVAPSFTTSPPTTAIVGTSFTYTVGTAGTPAPSLAGTTLPAWLTLSGAILSGTPPSAGTFGVVLTATNGVNPPATQSFSIVATAAQPSVTLATIDMAGQPGNQTSTAATQLAANIGAPAPAISRGPGISPVSGSGSINSDGWTQGPVLGPDDYYTVTVRPAAGFALSISSLAVGGRRSSTSGPATIDVRSSRDGFVASLATFTASAGSSQTVSIPLAAAALLNVAGPIELRLFGYGATASGATYRVESLAVSGTLTAIAAGSFAPSFTSTPPTIAATGIAYSAPLGVTGNPAPTVVATGLPSGIALTGSAAAGYALAGTPSGAGTFNVVLTATNGVNPPAVLSFQIVVSAAAAPVFASAPVTSATALIAYDYFPFANGSPLPTIAVASTTAPWLTFSNGALGGIPPFPGVFDVTLTATNVVGTATQGYKITVAANTAPPTSNAFVQFEFATQTAPAVGNEPSWAAETVDPRLPAPVMTRAGITPSQASNAFGATGFPTVATLSTAHYFTFTTTPTSGLTMSLDRLDFEEERSNSGPQSAAVRSSIDGFSANLITFSPAVVTFTRVPHTITLTAAPFQNLGTPVEFRLYGFNAGSGTGTMRIDKVFLTGTLRPITGGVAPGFTSTAPTSATVGAAYTYAIAVTGNPAPAVTSSTLPSGLALSGNTVSGFTISGVPAVTGTSQITLTASNGVGSPATQTFPLTIVLPPGGTTPPALSGTPVTAATVGAAYSYAFTATGVPPPSISFTATPAAPWLSISGGAGSFTLSGTPAFANIGSVGVTLIASNGAGADATQSFAIQVSGPVTGDLATFTFAGQPGNQAQTLASSLSPQVAGGVALVRGSGLTAAAAGNSMSSSAWSTGAIDLNDYYGFTVTPVAGVQLALSELAFAHRISSATGPAQGSVRTSLDGFTADVGSFTTSQTAATPVTITLSATPALQSVTGAITLRIYAFGAGASGSTLRLEDVLSLRGTATTATATAPSFTSAAPPTTATAGISYSAPVTVAGNPAPSVTLTSAPAWLSLAGGVLSGTPGAGDVGSSGVVITAANGTAPDAVLSFTINVSPSAQVAPQITSTPASTATVGVGYSYTVVATGNPTPTVTATNLPAWLSRTGNLISGTPAAGDVGTTGTITITASNGVGASATQPFQIAVTATATPPPGPSVALVTVTFTGQPGNQAQTPAIFVAPEITGPVALVRGSGVSASSAGNCMTSSGWSTGAIDLNDYYGITVTPAAGLQLTLTELAFSHRVSGTGPTVGRVRSSLDGFTADVGTFTTSQTAATPIAIPLTTTAALQSVTTTVTLRIYGFTAGAAGGTFRIEGTLTLSGTATAATLASPPADGPGALAQGSTETEGEKLGAAGSSARDVEVVSAGEGAPSRGTTAGSLETKTSANARDARARRKAAEERRAARAALVPGLPGTPPVTAKVGERYEHRIVATGTPAPSIEVTGLPSWLTRRGDVLEGVPTEADLGASGRIDVTARIAGVSEAAAQRFTVTVLPATQEKGPLALAEGLEGGVLPRGWTQAGGDLDTPSLDLREIARPTLRFQHLHRGPGSLVARVVVSTDGGLTFREAAAWLLEGGLYGALVVDLAPALEGRAAGNVVIRFESASVTDAAWVVEEVRVGEVWAVME